MVTPFRQIDWYSVINSIVPYELAKVSFPSIVSCARCGGTAAIFYDSLYCDIWHFCFSCRWGADAVDLAAYSWGIPKDAAVARFTTELLPQYIRDCSSFPKWYSRYAENQEYVSQNLKTASQSFLSSVPVMHIAHALNIDVRASDTWWYDKMGKFCGAFPGSLVRKLCMRFLPSHIRPSVSDSSEYLGIYFSSVPGRHSGILLFWQEDSVLHYSFIPLHGGRLGAFVESGIGFLDCAFNEIDAPDVFGDDVIVCTDAVVALGLQAKHLRDHADPLPIVATHACNVFGRKIKPARTASGWENLFSKRLTFWSTKPDSELFQSALDASAEYVSTYSPTTNQYLLIPKHLLVEVIRNRKSWRSALYDFITNASDETLRKLSSTPYYRVANELPLPRNIRAKLNRVSLIPERATFFINDRAFVETQAGWRDVKFGKYVTNANIRILEIAVQNMPNRTYYRLEITDKADNRMIVLVPRRVLYGSNKSNLCKLILQECGFDLRISLPYKSFLLGLTRVSTPEVLKYPSDLGWDGVNCSFHFPNFRIEKTGVIRRCRFPSLSESDYLTKFVYSWQKLFGRSDIEGLPKSFLAFISCVIANAAAPIFKKRVLGIALTGGTRDYLSIVKSGWDTSPQYWSYVQFDSFRSRYLPLAAPALAEWPNGSPDVTRFEYQNIVIPIDEIKAKLLSIRAPWYIIKEVEEAPPKDLTNLATGLIVEWFRKLFKYRLVTPFSEPIFIDDILKSICLWLDSISDYPSYRACIDDSARSEHGRIYNLLDVLAITGQSDRVLIPNSSGTIFDYTALTDVYQRFTIAPPSLGMISELFRSVGLIDNAVSLDKEGKLLLAIEEELLWTNFHQKPN